MKKLLCYLGILVLLGLVLMPPILRITLPKNKETEKTSVVESKILSCSNDELIIKASYENDKVKMIVMKKMNVEEKNKSEALIKVFDEIKNNGNISYNKVEDGEVISIDFSISNHNDLNINTLTEPIESQKILYENQQLNCTIQ